jgi:hypothetical protein
MDHGCVLGDGGDIYSGVWRYHFSPTWDVFFL